MTATIRTSGLDPGFKVKPHVQAFADAVQAKFGITSFGTYKSHEPTPDRAVDTFVNKEQGDRLAAWSIQPEVMKQYGIDYTIWWQRIFNPEVAPYWRDMADRGGTTQNHKDHNHDSFDPTAPAAPSPEDDMTNDQAGQLKNLHDMLVEFKTPGGGTNFPNLKELQAKVDKLASGGVDLDALAKKVADTLAARLKD